jgi:hypothetical protein
MQSSMNELNQPSILAYIGKAADIAATEPAMVEWDWSWSLMPTLIHAHGIGRAVDRRV